jgi:hypothetical protein
MELPPDDRRRRRNHRTRRRGGRGGSRPARPRRSRRGDGVSHKGRGRRVARDVRAGPSDASPMSVFD